MIPLAILGGSVYLAWTLFLPTIRGEPAYLPISGIPLKINGYRATELYLRSCPVPGEPTSYYWKEAALPEAKRGLGLDAQGMDFKTGYAIWSRHKPGIIESRLFAKETYDREKAPLFACSGTATLELIPWLGGCASIRSYTVIC